eukprot:gnl/Spiro4/8780_TR4614_c0_g1_i1.p1 gnl/Spiro4/8780_TR4614_c0_g1~~gnl/Spiro4/8780_TR4614_c0_g1_i1.p1  ORF type:complete len:597 (+),score=103.12 gnl/Spiro4/8780_TR4614_c0_g1_i1:56-1846(+)
MANVLQGAGLLPPPVAWSHTQSDLTNSEDDSSALRLGNSLAVWKDTEDENTRLREELVRRERSIHQVVWEYHYETADGVSVDRKIRVLCVALDAKTAIPLTAIATELQTRGAEVQFAMAEGIEDGGTFSGFPCRDIGPPPSSKMTSQQLRDLVTRIMVTKSHDLFYTERWLPYARIMYKELCEKVLADEFDLVLCDSCSYAGLCFAETRDIPLVVVDSVLMDTTTGDSGLLRPHRPQSFVYCVYLWLLRWARAFGFFLPNSVRYCVRARRELGLTRPFNLLERPLVITMPRCFDHARDLPPLVHYGGILIPPEMPSFESLRAIDEFFQQARDVRVVYICHGGAFAPRDIAAETVALERRAEEERAAGRRPEHTLATEYALLSYVKREHAVEQHRIDVFTSLVQTLLRKHVAVVWEVDRRWFSPSVETMLQSEAQLLRVDRESQSSVLLHQRETGSPAVSVFVGHISQTAMQALGLGVPSLLLPYGLMSSEHGRTQRVVELGAGLAGSFDGADAASVLASQVEELFHPSFVTRAYNLSVSSRHHSIAALGDFVEEVMFSTREPAAVPWIQHPTSDFVWGFLGVAAVVGSFLFWYRQR